MFDNYEWFKSKVLALTAIDLNAYKERQMKRRIDALITKNKLNSYEEYLNLLRKDKVALKAFVNYLTINVSEFFRNTEQWKVFENTILPYLFEKKGKKLKIWSAACSTGDEPYTIAMILLKHMARTQFELIATDIDDQVLAKAQSGMYNSKSIAGVPNEFKSYFTDLGSGTYQISDKIMSCVKFKQHNLLKDPYPTNCDLIVCRNVLIYFTDEAKDNIFHKFNRSLNSNGVLFIGNTEQILSPKTFGYKAIKSFFYTKDSEA
ncbi:MAG: protein-glutamate O-methyltransferase CheR [Lachnospiraceae bacterium]|nr:protein-glutamate O-methyltransferase CheR [Lachnospiraceae bacterium]